MTITIKNGNAKINCAEFFPQNSESHRGNYEAINMPNILIIWGRDFL